MQWGHVSNLIAITDNDAGKRYTYKYNDQGIRTEKVVNGVAHKYYLQGEQIIAERYGGSLIKFYYDSTGVCGFRYYNKEKDGDNSNGTDYYYQKNIQGDILRIFDKNGNLKAEYSYDAWGKCTIKTNVSGIAAINPFRYRGYYLDDETGLYYLNARYYDPEIGRFISPDSIDYLDPESINGLNIYVYCGNNPIMYVDPNGNFIVSIGVSLTLICAAVLGISLIYLGTQTNLFSSLINDIGYFFSDLSYFLSDLFYIEDNYLYSKKNEPYKPKRMGQRVKGKSKKDAEEKARRRGGGKKPIHHKGAFNRYGKWIGPHYHPNVPDGHPYKHDHYFYTMFLLLLGELWEDEV